jgi:GNAT superfamily N-acetyltransferase
MGIAPPAATAQRRAGGPVPWRYHAGPMADSPSRSTAPGAGYALQPLAGLTVGEVLQHYEELTFPPVARRLAVRSTNGVWCGAVALGAGGPVGLALVEVAATAEPGTAQLFSLAVLPDHRGRKLGGALVGVAERVARDAGCVAIQGAFRTSWRDCPAIEALLASRGWSSPETRMVLARSESAFAHAYLRAPATELPVEAEIFSWEQLTAAERGQILGRQEDDPWFPAVLTPFQEEPRLEPTISVGLRWQGEVTGWLICHRVAFDTLQYSAYFVRQDLRGRGLGQALLREGIRRRLADPDIRRAILAVDARNHRVRALVEGRFRHFFTGISELRVSGKRLDE